MTKLYEKKLAYHLLFLIPDWCLDIGEWHMPTYERKDRIGDTYSLNITSMSGGQTFCRSAYIKNFNSSQAWIGKPLRKWG